jgi:hypothetical protein
MQTISAAHRAWCNSEVRYTILDSLDKEKQRELVSLSREGLDSIIRSMWRCIEEEDYDTMWEAKPPIVSSSFVLSTAIPVTSHAY